MPDEINIDRATRIHGAKIFKASTLLKKPIADATHTLSEISFIVLRIFYQNKKCFRLPGYRMQYHCSLSYSLGHYRKFDINTLKWLINCT